MAKTMSEQAWRHIHHAGRLSTAESDLTPRRRTPHRRMGTAPPALFKATSQSPAEYSVAN